jgi:hypothetical protein
MEIALMSKVVINYDTKSKEISVEMDGQSIANVETVCVSKRENYYNDSDESEIYGCSILTLDNINEEGYKKYGQIVASEKNVKKVDPLHDQLVNLFADIRESRKNPRRL